MTDELPIVSLDAFTLFPGLPACEGLTLDLVPSTLTVTETADPMRLTMQGTLDDPDTRKEPL